VTGPCLATPELQSTQTTSSGIGTALTAAAAATTASFPGQPGYQKEKGKTSLNLNDARDDGVLGWQWHQLDHMQTICTSLQTDNLIAHFLQAGYSS